MDVANASLYDGASSLAEAVLMASRVHPGRRRIVMARSVHPEWRRVVDTYLSNLDHDVVEVGFGPDGRLDEAELTRVCDATTMVVCVQSPNFFGVIEKIDRASAAARAADALLVTAVAEPFSLGMLRSPGDLGADVVCGRRTGVRQSRVVRWAISRSLRDAREVPAPDAGRLAGEARDVDGRRGFVLTLSTREQHIRRGKATSNICTNQGLCALAATIHLALLGRRGLAAVARLNHARAEYAKQALASAGARLAFTGPTFNEFRRPRSRRSRSSARPPAGRRHRGRTSARRVRPGFGDALAVARPS
jgi:glycine dehydrogenase subunit 1